jgi:hypothetical protein
MVIKRELDRVGDRVLVQTEFIGVSGQVCSVVYELTGPTPEYFTDVAVAQIALQETEADQTPVALTHQR